MVTLTFLSHNAQGIRLFFYPEDPNWKENLNVGLQEGEKNERRDFTEHYNRACYVLN